MSTRSLPLLSLSLLALLAYGCQDSDAGSTAQPLPQQEEDPPQDPEDPPEEEVERPPQPEGHAPGLDAAIFPALGSSDFLTANERELLSDGSLPNGYWGANGRGEMSDDLDADAAESDGAAPPAQEVEAEPDPNREIVEADIVQQEGDLLYLLNRYRGLIIVDLSRPDAPRVVGRLPFQAVPVEMYLRDGRAYVVMSDYFVYWQYDPDADPLGFHGSQILIVDVSDASAPRELGRQLIEGEVSDTRMVGDVLYTVSKRRPDYWRYNTADWEDRTWIVSLNVADPQNIREIDRITFQGTSTLIHVAQHAIFVAAWDPNYYLVDPEHEQETLITYVDISDAAGDLRERGTIYIPGTIQDKFKMDWHEHTLRVMSQRWGSASEGWLHVIDTQHPDQLELLADLEISEAQWGRMLASRYAGPRAYVVSLRYDQALRRNRAYLHVLDLAEPAAPRHSAELEIDLQVTHFIVQGDRLLALGQQLVSSGRSKVEMALYDVSNVAGPRRISRVLLGEGYSYSAANGDYKALKVVPELELILLPLSYSYRVDNGPWQRFDGTQLVDWRGDALAERGQIASVGRPVLRAFPMGERLVAMSDSHIQVIDASDRDRPRETAALYLQRTVYEVFEIQGRQVQLVAPEFGRTLRFEVLPFGPKDDAPAQASLELPFGSAPVVFRDGDVLHLLGWEPNRTGQILRNADFSDVLAPRLAGELLLGSEVDAIYSGGVSHYWRYWNPNAGLALRNQILPFTVRQVHEGAGGRRYWESQLRLIDLRDVAAPRIAEGALPMNDFPFVNKVTHGNVLYSTHVEQAITGEGEQLLYHVKAWVDRVDVSDPDHPVLLPSLNVPGWLIDVSEDGSLLYTIDYQWDDFGRRRNSLDILRVEGDRAVLVDVLPVGDQVHRALFRDRTLWIAQHKYPWWGVRGETVASRQPYTVLEQVRVGRDGRIVGHSQATLAGYPFQLLDLEAGRAYLASTGPTGVLVLDVEDPAAPRISASARSIGYVSKVVPFEDYLYLPLGAYGVHRMPLTLVQ